MQSSKLKVKSFLKLKIKEVPLEDAHGGSGKRKMLLSHDHVASKNWEAITKGYLEKGGIFDWHKHDDADEVFIVLKGTGQYFCDGKIMDFTIEDVFITPAKLEHKITADEDCEFYFIRVKV